MKNIFIKEWFLMLKEKFDKTMEFVKEHKAEILLTATTGTLLVVGYKNKEEIIELANKLTNVTDIAKRSITREISRVTFEIAELKESIDRLDPTIEINKFSRIPERKARIEELTIQLADLYLDRDKL